MNRKHLGMALIIIGVFLIAFVLYRNSRYPNTTRPFSSYTLLTSSWEKYKDKFINEDGRVIDFSQQDITTSEGQSYALLRAVFVDDKTSFDKAWEWTKDNLKRDGDDLFGWRWGLNENGVYDFIINGGSNSASDADSDIALALIMAGKRWGDETYIDEAKAILTDMWNMETAVINNKRYLSAGNWAETTNEVVINPSYFAPYAWRIFSEIDSEHDWNSLIEPGYELLNQTSQNMLDKESSSGLPPDWVVIDKTNGTIKASNMGNLSTNYSFDAIRVPWRIALDYEWNKNEEAKAYLEKSFGKLRSYYLDYGKLPAAFTHDGSVVLIEENPAMYATALSYLMIADPTLAEKLYQEKIISLYSNDSNSFDPTLGYYDLNWLWFGTALYKQFLNSYVGNE